MKILTGHQRRLLEKIRTRGRNQMTLVRSAQFPKIWATALEKKGYIWLSTSLERGTYFAAWTGKDPDAPEPAKETATAKEKKPGRRVKVSFTMRTDHAEWLAQQEGKKSGIIERALDYFQEKNEKNEKSSDIKIKRDILDSTMGNGLAETQKNTGGKDNVDS
jgi:hypothetical protein